MTIADIRRAIRPLLNEGSPADAQAAYYAFYHADEKTEIVPWPAGESRALGYICLAKTGIDLFRPLITLRLPNSPDTGNVDPVAGAELFHSAVPDGMAIILSAPLSYRPLLGALLEIQNEQEIELYRLDRLRFEPLISVLVTSSETYNGLPRFIVRQPVESKNGGRGEVVASAGLNWRSSNYAEIYVHTKASYRRQGLGRSVVATLVQHVLDSGRTPLYAVNATNQPSIQLAESVGFVYSGTREILIEGVMQSRL